MDPDLAPDPGTDLSVDRATARTQGVMTQLAVALNVLVAALLGLTVVGSWDGLAGLERVWALVLVAAFAVVYVAGTVAVRHRRVTARQRLWWLAAVTALWTLLVVHVPESAYLAFPLFFLALVVLGPVRGIPAVVALTIVAVVALGAHRGWTAGGTVGPVLGALVAIGIGLGIRALRQESEARMRLIAELVATRGQLAASEREAGREAERARLAAEIHDTVAQGLGSIAMLLHAVERADPEHPSVARVRAARSTAQESLAETRRLVAALRPAVLEGTTLGGAIERLGARLADENPGVDVRVDVAEDLSPGQSVASALVRIAQESTGNALAHGRPSTLSVSLDREDGAVRLVVTDDGAGFDPDAPRRQGSFGLEGMARRAADLGGHLEVDSRPGGGTRVTAVLPAAETAGAR